MRDFPANPNVTDAPLPIDAAMIAAVAKTGCRECHGAGRVRVTEQPHRIVVDAQGNERKIRARVVGQACPPEAGRGFVLCPCVRAKAAGRLDIGEVNGTIVWAPAQRPADASGPVLREAAP